jgi:hypothetical protein
VATSAHAISSFWPEGVRSAIEQRLDGVAALESDTSHKRWNTIPI